MKSVNFLIVLLTTIAFAIAAEDHSPCEGIEEDIFINNPASCRSFYFCSGGRATPGECDEKYYFNFVDQMCDWPANVDCVNTPITPEPETTTESSAVSDTTTEEETEAPTSTEVQSEPSTNIDTTTSIVVSTTEEFTEITTDAVTEPRSACDGETTGVLVKNADDCGAFFHCVDNAAFLNRCPPGLLFNGVYCDLEERVSCGGETTTEEVTEVPEQPLCVPGDTSLTLHQHPTSCSHYRMCFNGQQFEVECGPREHFSLEKRACVPREVAKCRIEDPLCPSDTIVFLPNPHFCHRLFLCFHGELADMTCADGHHFDPENGWCIDANTSSCVD